MALITPILKSFSQIFFLDNVLFGAVIVLGLGFVSPIALILALIGSISSEITSGLLNLQKDFVGNDVSGFSGVLVGAAMAFYVKNIPLAIVLTIALSVFATILFWLLNRNNIPPLAAPFVLAVWVFLLASRYIK